MTNLMLAGLLGLVITLLGTPLAIMRFRSVGWGQLIREEGPRAHYEKRGTPTMGGLVILAGTVIGYAMGHIGRGGFVETAMRAGVPIVPIAVVGAEESMPILARSGTLARLLKVPFVPLTANMVALGPLGLVTYFPAKFKLRVLDPIHFDVPSGKERYSRSRVMEESERIRTEIQDALYDMLSRRRSVWFG